MQSNVIASRQRDNSADGAFRRPSLQIAFCLECLREIKAAQDIEPLHLRLSGMSALMRRANADVILLSFSDGVRFAITSKKTIAAGKIAGQFATRNSMLFQFRGS